MPSGLLPRQAFVQQVMIGWNKGDRCEERISTLIHKCMLEDGGGHNEESDWFDSLFASFSVADSLLRSAAIRFRSRRRDSHFPSRQMGVH